MIFVLIPTSSKIAAINELVKYLIFDNDFFIGALWFGSDMTDVPDCPDSPALSIRKQLAGKALNFTPNVIRNEARISSTLTVL